MQILSNYSHAELVSASIIGEPMNYRLIDFEIHGDARGKLVALENNKEIPFEVKRVYYMFDTLPNESRGFHAHKNVEKPAKWRAFLLSVFIWLFKEMAHEEKICPSDDTMYRLLVASVKCSYR